jgi:pilus assembly protein CpaE
MSIMQPKNGDVPGWRPYSRNFLFALFLSAPEMAQANALGASLNGFIIQASMVEPAQPIASEAFSGAHVVAVEVAPSVPASVERFTKLAQAIKRPLVALVREPTLDLVRRLMRAGAKDVLDLPLNLGELESLLGGMAEELTGLHGEPGGKIVSVVKSVGGVGATALLTQAACLLAEREATHGREVCLLDLDIQFGSAAMYLGQVPKLTLADLLEAGSRIDGAMLRSTASRHHSGLDVVAAPLQIMPLEAIGSDQMLSILELAAAEYGTVLIDLPGSWTNWSLSALARSDVILLVTELSVAGLHQARRQLDMLASHDLGGDDVHVVVNRVEKRVFKPISMADAERAIGRHVTYRIAEDPDVVSTALNQGLMLSQVKTRNAVTKDLTKVVESICRQIGRDG